jgi:trehalose/maltose hydrolase-like predicted phosphorylase
MDVVLGRERTQRSRVVKQADVVALLALLPRTFGREVEEANFRYYERRCGHGSSLSRGLHAMVAARIGDIELAYRYFRETAAIDMADSLGASAGGVRIAALGGLWQATVFGFAGLGVAADELTIDPRLPHHWRSLQLRVQWRGRQIALRLGQGEVEVSVESGEPVPMTIKGQQIYVEPTAPKRVAT